MTHKPRPPADLGRFTQLRNSQRMRSPQSLLKRGSKVSYRHEPIAGFGVGSENFESRTSLDSAEKSASE